MSNLLEVKNLTVGFKVRDSIFTAVEDASFEINKNETMALVGESGSGKSVSAMSILQLLPEGKTIFSKGSSIKFHHSEILEMSNKQLQSIRGKKISMIFQEPMTSLNPYHRVGNQITESILSHEDISKKDAEKKAKELMELVEIPDLERRYKSYPHELSGGQRQRIMIAMSLINEPELLIADEPTTALDVTIQAQILDLMNKLKQKLGMSILFITHDLGLVEKFSDRVCVMKEGKIVEQGITTEIFANPKHEYTIKLLKSEPKEKDQLLVSEDNILDISNLSVFYKIPSKKLFKTDRFCAVSDISLKIPRNSTVGVVGESGSGKSTLGKAIINLLDFEGSIKFNDKSIKDLSSAEKKLLKKDIQIVFQDPYGSLSPRMTVGEIIGEGLDIHFDFSNEEKIEKISNVMKDVGLDDSLIFKYPHEFSGGQRQRIAIARSIILNPKFMILDEPTSALDRSIQIQVIDVLKRLQDKYKLTYLFISHDLKVIRSMCDQIFVMSEGKLVEYGKADEVFENPKQEYTQKLLRAALKYSSN